MNQHIPTNKSSQKMSLRERVEDTPLEPVWEFFETPSLARLGLVTAVSTTFAYFFLGWLLSFWNPGPSAAQSNSTEIFNVMKILEYRNLNNGEYPTGKQEVWQELLKPSKTIDGESFPALLTEIPSDSWGNVLFYEYPNTKAPMDRRPAVWSAGPDGVNDNGENDDIVSWK